MAVTAKMAVLTLVSQGHATQLGCFYDPEASKETFTVLDTFATTFCLFKYPIILRFITIELAFVLLYL